MPDEHLLELVEALPRIPFEGTAFRHIGPRYPPLSGEGARIQGGRWNPPESFPTLYLALSVETTIAEFYRSAARMAMRPEDLLPRRLYRYRVALTQLLDLTGAPDRRAVDLTREDLSSDDLGACQAVADAAHHAGFEGILAPSGTGIGEVLAVFFDRLEPGSLVEPLGFEPWDAPPRP